MMVGDCNPPLLELLVRRCKSEHLISRFNLGVACFLRLIDDCIGTLLVAALTGGEGMLTTDDAGEEAACDDCEHDDEEEGDFAEKVLLQSWVCVCKSFSHSSLCCRSCDICSS